MKKKKYKKREQDCEIKRKITTTYEIKHVAKNYEKKKKQINKYINK